MKLKEKLDNALTNREYKSIRRNSVESHRFGSRGWCSVCQGICGWMYFKNKKRNRGQKPKKLKPWQKNLAS